MHQRPPVLLLHCLAALLVLLYTSGDTGASLTCLQCSNCQNAATPTAQRRFAYCREPTEAGVEPFCVNKTTRDGRVYRGCGKPYMNYYRNGCQAQVNAQTLKQEVVCRCPTSNCNGPDTAAAVPDVTGNGPETVMQRANGKRLDIGDGGDGHPGADEGITAVRTLWRRVHKLSTYLSILLVPIVMVTFILCFGWLVMCYSLNRRIILQESAATHATLAT